MGELRDIPDWEFADGSPAPHTRRRYAHEHYRHKILYQFIKAGACVESRAAEGSLPRVPGTKEQRDWDPQIPLFLEDVDEAGAAPPPGYVPYTPGEFVHEPLVHPDQTRRPYWSKRAWHITKEYLMRKPQRNKNTIGDGK
jgi:hypothetical protein